MTPVAPVTGTAPFEPRDPGFLRDPHAYFAGLREQGPVFIDPASGQWFMLGHDEVDAGLQIAHGEPKIPESENSFPANPFQLDGPGHAEPRRIITPGLRSRSVQRFRERAQQIVDAALAGKPGGGELRVVEEIGFALPYHLTCDLLGIPDVDNADELRSWTWKTLDLIDAFPTPEQLQGNLEAARCLADHIEAVTEWKRRNLSDDLFSAVIAAADAGEVMRADQVVPYIHTLYLAGMHTTVNQTALALWALLEHRAQWDLLLAQPSLLENAVEELLRFEPTAQYMRRIPDHDVTIGDVTIPSGTKVVCWIASANRDQKRWGPTADDLDITRPDARQHLAFGRGAHVCVGSWLARMELAVVLETILGRYPATRLVEQELVWSSNVIRGPQELLLSLRPAG
ncbi:MAG TPA: cytochrome P450 [Frankiaceae bacterium]|nr:cytochrome P450 [Frankiaceae bacterium]